MKALILAAGFARRLRPLTNKIPKCLVEVNGIPLLENALNQLKANGIQEAIIVVGHMKEKVSGYFGHEFNGIRITYVENNIYDKTNNVYSLWLARDYLCDDLIMVECDLFYRATLLAQILESKADCGILTSPFNPATMDGTVLDVDSQRRVRSLIINRDQGEGFDYSGKEKTVNIYRFSKDFLVNHFLPILDFYVRNEGVNSYYELVLGALIYLGGSRIEAVSVSEKEWCEIDDLEDMKRAEVRFGN